MKMCEAPGCNRPARSGRAKYCEMHYYRLRRRGELTLRDPKPFIGHSGGYIQERAPEHPLARGSYPYVFQHRKVYYDHHGAGPFCCHHCGVSVTWETLHIDHLDDDPKNNDLSNLAASCPKCNQARGWHKMRESMRAKFRTITHNGETLAVSEWSERTGIGRTTIQNRLKKGWSIARALSAPIGPTGCHSGAKQREERRETRAHKGEEQRQ